MQFTPQKTQLIDPPTIDLSDLHVGEAFDLMTESLAGQVRECGERTAIHATRMAASMQPFKLGNVLECACLLHEIDITHATSLLEARSLDHSDPIKRALELMKLYNHSRIDKLHQAQEIYRACEIDCLAAFLLGAEVRDDCPTLSHLKDPERELAYVIKVLGQFEPWLPKWRTYVPDDLKPKFDDLWNINIELARIELERLCAIPGLRISRIRLRLYLHDRLAARYRFFFPS